MSFILEASKIGKDTILYNNHKYRESYSVKSGEIVWRCLGKTCKASIRTDKTKNAIYSSNESHSGQHPITMRSLTPTSLSRAASAVSTPTRPYNSTTPATSHIPSEDIVTPSAVQQPEQSTPLPTSDLQEENNALRKQLEEVREELRVILDHSIESDQRLLQYTEDVFLPPSSTHGLLAEVCSLTSVATQTEEDCTLTTECAIQCSLTSCLINDKLGTPNGNLAEIADTDIIYDRDLAKIIKMYFDQHANYNKIFESRLSSLEHTAKESISDYLGQKTDLVRNNDILTSPNPSCLAENNMLKNVCVKHEASISSLKLELVQKTNSYYNLLASLKDPTRNWLCDDTLTSYFNILQEEISTQRDDVLFLAPSVTQALKLQSKRHVNILLSDMSFNTAKWVFFCLNNSVTRSESDSGTHWSLLLYHVDTHCATHYDSMQGANLGQAKKLLENIGLQNATLVEGAVPRQSAWYECGLHVITNARLLVSQLCAGTVIPQLPAVQHLGGDANSQLTIHPQDTSSKTSSDNTSASANLEADRNETRGWSKVGKKKYARSSMDIPLTVICKNKFAILDECDSGNISVSNTSTDTDLVGQIKYVVNQRSKCKNKILVLSDSQGRNLHPYIENLSEDYDVCVHCKPGARLKDIVRDSKCLIENCSINDFVVLLGGTNDIGECKPSQFSITQGLKAFLSLNVNTNVIINSIPYRYDTNQFNDNIFYANMVITRLVREYKGPLKLSYGELNTILRRNHFTRHGLHLNKAGKRVLAKNIVHTISSRRSKLPGAGGDKGRGYCRDPKAPCNRRTVNQVKDVECEVSLIEPYPSPEMTSAPRPARGTFQTSDSEDCFQITSLKDFPPLPLNTHTLQSCNVSTETHTSNLPTSQNQSPVFLDKIITIT